MKLRIWAPNVVEDCDPRRLRPPGSWGTFFPKKESRSCPVIYSVGVSPTVTAITRPVKIRRRSGAFVSGHMVWPHSRFATQLPAFPTLR